MPLKPAPPAGCREGSRTKSGRLPRPLPHYAESGRLGRRQPSAAPRDRRPRRSARPGRHRKTGRLVTAARSGRADGPARAIYKTAPRGATSTVATPLP